MHSYYTLYSLNDSFKFVNHSQYSFVLNESGKIIGVLPEKIIEFLSFATFNFAISTIFLYFALKSIRKD